LQMTKPSSANWAACAALSAIPGRRRLLVFAKSQRRRT
jgi:hypothetical protein